MKPGEMKTGELNFEQFYKPELVKVIIKIVVKKQVLTEMKT